MHGRREEGRPAASVALRPRHLPAAFCILPNYKPLIGRLPVINTAEIRKQTVQIGLVAMLASIAVSAVPLFAGHVTWWRAVAHFLGFAGMAAWLVSLLSRDQGERIEDSLPRILMAATAGIGVIWLANHAGKMSGVAASAIAMAIMVGAFLRAILGEVVTWPARRYSVSLTLLFCLVVSGLWELLNQPFVDAYGAGPRGLFQWEQVIADTAGTVLGARWAVRRLRHDVAG